jgi:hypothetical protein
MHAMAIVECLGLWEPTTDITPVTRFSNDSKSVCGIILGTRDTELLQSHCNQPGCRGAVHISCGYKTIISSGTLVRAGRLANLLMQLHGVTRPHLTSTQQVLPPRSVGRTGPSPFKRRRMLL